MGWLTLLLAPLVLVRRRPRGAETPTRERARTGIALGRVREPRSLDARGSVFREPQEGNVMNQYSSGARNAAYALITGSLIWLV